LKTFAPFVSLFTLPLGLPNLLHGGYNEYPHQFHPLLF